MDQESALFREFSRRVVRCDGDGATCLVPLPLVLLLDSLLVVTNAAAAIPHHAAFASDRAADCKGEQVGGT